MIIKHGLARPFDRSQRTFWVSIGLSLLSLALTIGCSKLEGSQQAEEQIHLVTRAPMVVTVEASGVLVSDNSSYLACPKITNMWEFRIAYMAPEGTTVHKGMPVVKFEDKEAQETLLKFFSQLNTARKNLKKTQLDQVENLETQELELAKARVKADKAKRKAQVPEQLKSRTELQKARLEAQRDALEVEALEQKIGDLKRSQEAKTRWAGNQVESLEAKISQLESDVEKLTLKAPREGMLVHTRNWRDEKLKVGDSVWFGNTVAEIPDLTAMSVKATIAEVDAGRVAVGQPVEIRLDANPDKIYRGKIRALGSIFRAKSHNKPSTVFDAEITIDQPDPEMMRPGMTTSLSIQVDRLEDTISIPRDALHFDNRQPFVKLRDEGWSSEREVPVEVGVRNGETIQITAGLKEGHRVLLSRESNGNGGRP